MSIAPLNFYFEVPPERSKFYSIFVDVTHKCNMECANCYVPNRDIDDLDIDKFYYFLEKLTKKTEIRLIGGEPTVRKDLPDIISKIRSAGHRPTMMTNGLKLAKEGYARDLADAGMRSIYLSMNGADDDKVYEIMDGVACAERKIQALESCAKVKMNINIGAILQKDTNNHVPLKLLNLVNSLKINAILRFRNVGQIGRYALSKNDNWSFDDMVELVCSQFNIDKNWALKFDSINGFKEKNVIFFPMNPNDTFKTNWVKITDWSPAQSLIPDPGNLRRGRLTQNFTVAPFFEHVKLNENQY